VSYAQQSNLYRDQLSRSRIDMCIREQGYIYATAPDPQDASLGQNVTAGSPTDIDAVAAAVCVSPNYLTLEDDGALLAAVQSVWHTVAQARYPAMAVPA
jgi:hypothetical protein